MKTINLYAGENAMIKATKAEARVMALMQYHTESALFPVYTAGYEMDIDGQT
jgi:hypothetical protein